MTMEKLIRALEGIRSDVDGLWFLDVVSGMLKSPAAKMTMLKVDRANFCAEESYYDSPQSIGHNATISAPHMHAFALEQSLTVKNVQRILDVGSGSGYLTACYAAMYPEASIIGIEHIPALVIEAERNVRKNNADLLSRLTFIVGDGREGYIKMAPYDIIHVGAAASEIPVSLLKQLNVGGLMIIPVGSFWQDICTVRKKTNGEIEVESKIPVRYVPLTDRDTQEGH